MSDDHRTASPRTRSGLRRFALTSLAILLLLGGAAVISYWIQASEPTARREAATRRSAALVATTSVTRGTYRPTISVLGAVQPARQIILSPRVGGEILEVGREFRPGGLVDAGEVLLRIDPADYELARVMRESEFGQVEAELAIEQGRQRAAEHEFELLGENIDPANRALVLREPQIASLRNKLRAAKAAVDQAKLDVTRTQVAAPFDAQILERFTERGARVAPGDQLARLVGTDEYWVVATVPLAAIRWIQFPSSDDDDLGATARVHHRGVWPKGTTREGVVRRLIGEVDSNTRFARVIVSLQNPIGSDDGPPLILGTLVQVEIEAIPLVDVVKLDRAYLRQGDTVWVMSGDELRIRKVEVTFSDSSHAYLRSGLAAGDKVVTTSLATVADGLSIREDRAEER
tara:strand:- start:7963 stop:9174 length:1212 start_codon:yes stop_codon:yes gene_type:complete